MNFMKNGFNCQNLNITSSHIIDIIVKELIQLDNNEKFNLI